MKLIEFRDYIGEVFFKVMKNYSDVLVLDQ